MALTPERIEEISREHLRVVGAGYVRPSDATDFARAIEAEVRKDDEALVRQLVEALEGYRRNHNDGQPCDAEKAGRARLEKAP